MKKSKKIKLITSLSSSTVIASVAAIVGTGFVNTSKNSKTKLTSSSTTNSTTNGTDISTMD